MIAIFITGSVFVFLTTFLFLYKYSNYKETGYFALIVIFACTFFPLSSLYLLPIDLSTTDYAICKNISSSSLPCPEPAAFVNPNIIASCWSIAYWLSQCGTWIIIPVLSQYSDSGQFTRKARLWNAIKANIIYYLAVGILGMGFVIYLYFGLGKNSWQSLIGFLMALANVYGMVLVMSFLGHGLVDFPRSLWKKASVEGYLKALEFEAPLIRDELDDYIGEYSDAKSELLWLSKQRGLTPEIESHIKKMMERFPLNDIVRSSGVGNDSDSSRDIAQVNMKFLTGVNKRLKNGRLMTAKAECYWNHFLEKAFLMQDILRNRNNPDKRFFSITRKRPESSMNSLLSKIEWYYYVRIRHWFLRILSVLCSLLSIFIIWSEVTLFVVDENGKRNLSIFSILIHDPRAESTSIEVISFITILYLSVCAYTSLVKLKIFKQYVLVPKNHTDERTLLFYAAFLNRLNFPLCFNFLNLVGNVTGQETTQFSKVMGPIDLLPLLGRQFNTFVPILMAVVCFLVTFRLYSRILHCLGIQEFFFGSEDGEGLQDGRELIERARKLADRNGSQGHQLNDQIIPSSIVTKDIASSSRSQDVATRNAEFYSKYGDRLKKVREKHNYGGESGGSSDRENLLGRK